MTCLGSVMLPAHACNYFGQLAAAKSLAKYANELPMIHPACFCSSSDAVQGS